MTTRKVSTLGGGRLGSCSEDDSNIDTDLLVKYLLEDSEKLHTVKLNNISVEGWLLESIFEALKTSKNIKHLSLAGLGMKDEVGIELVKSFAANKSLESLNIESNDLTNESLEPLFELLETHPTIRELKCAHQKAGLGSRGEEAMARALEKNPNILKIGYPFNVPSARSLADRSQIRNQDNERKRRTSGQHFYNYKEEMARRDAAEQPWMKEEETPEQKNEKMLSDIGERKKSMIKVGGSMESRRLEAQQRAKNSAKPAMDNELANALGKARKQSRGVRY